MPVRELVPLEDHRLFRLLLTAMAVVAVLGERVADRQLARFRSNPENKGKTCRTGLWAYSRHPNYFFEWLLWFSFPLLAVGAGWWSAAAWFGPLLMLTFLFRFTGIPLTERQALRSRGSDYRRYQREVSAFVPWFPKQAHANGGKS